HRTGKTEPGTTVNLSVSFRLRLRLSRAVAWANYWCISSKTTRSMHMLSRPVIASRLVAAILGFAAVVPHALRADDPPLVTNFEKSALANVRQVTFGLPRAG